MLAPSVGAESLATQLVGHWRCRYEELVSEYVINGNGTFKGSLSYQGKVIWRNSGRWSLQGKSISTVLTESSTDKLPVGTKDRSIVLEVTSNTCRLQQQSGLILQYTRIR